MTTRIHVASPPGRRTLIAVTIIALALIPATARADTYHVAEGGVDGAAGSQAEPWGSISCAVGQAGAGDTVDVLRLLPPELDAGSPLVVPGDGRVTRALAAVVQGQF